MVCSQSCCNKSQFTPFRNTHQTSKSHNNYRDGFSRHDNLPRFSSYSADENVRLRSPAGKINPLRKNCAQCQSEQVGGRRAQILSLATRHGLSTIYAWRADAVAGRLMSYGNVMTDQFRQVGIYTGLSRVFQGSSRLR